jgi:hypothetical protein
VTAAIPRIQVFADYEYQWAAISVKGSKDGWMQLYIGWQKAVGDRPVPLPLGFALGVFLVLISILTFRYFERPMRRLIAGLGSGTDTKSRT